MAPSTNPGPKSPEGPASAASAALSASASTAALGAPAAGGERASLLALEAVIERLPVEVRDAVRRQAALLRAHDRAASEERYRFLADTTTDLVWTETPDGSVAFFNRHFARHAGLDPERARGAKWSSFLHPDDVPRYAARRAVAAGEGQPFALECRIRRQDGSHRWFLARLGPRGASGAVEEWVGTATDIDDQKRSAAQTDALFDGASIGIALLDRDLRFSRVNEAFAEVKGTFRHALVGRTVGEALPELAEAIEPVWRKVLETGEPVAQHELQGRTPDAPWGRTWLGNYYPVRVGGEPMGLAAVVTDISGRKRAEEALDLLSRAGEALASSLRADATLATLTRLMVPEFADWCILYGREPGEARTRQLALAHVDPARERDLDALFRTYRPRDDSAIGHPYVMRTGRSQLVIQGADSLLENFALDPEHLAKMRAFRMSSSVYVPLAVQGRVFGAISLARAQGRRPYDQVDLALAEELARRVSLALDNARLYEAARRERDRAEAASRAKDEFLATVSHELRTPLSAISGWAKLLRSGRLPEDKRARGLEAIEANAEAQTRLVDNMLDLGRVASGKLRLRVAPLSLEPVVRAALDATRPAAEAKGLRLASKLDDVGEITGDETRLRQIAWNLLTNAIKFTPAGGRVEVRLERRGSHVELRVADEGQGIDQALLPHAFEQFRQAEGEQARGKGGLGLGLALVKSLAELHGGSVAAESEGVGQGAVFTVRLPTGALSMPPPPPSLARGESPTPTLRALEGLYVLVVDDEGDVRDLVEAILSARGASVVTAESAPEGFELLQRLRPDVLISDISMPGEDGYSLLRRVRRLAPDAGGETPALALTAFARPEDRTRALLAGFNMHLAKPAEPNELVALLGKLVERARETNPPPARLRTPSFRTRTPG